MKEIVLISGKGGTGKTSITASYAMLGGADVVVCDCDVDAADLHLLLQPDFAKAEDFYSGFLANINIEKCSECGICVDTCRFDTIFVNKSGFIINPFNCEGCGYCSRTCPEEAITLEVRLAGKLFVSKTKAENIMVHARLGAGAENSGKLVTKVKKEAARLANENGKNYILIDGSPGIGCPVIASLTGADFVIFVTEPTVSGLHDLERVHELVKKFGIGSGCIINKYDLNREITERIEDFLELENIMHICNLPYNEAFTKAMTLGKTIIEYNDGVLSKIIQNSWKKILEVIN